MAAKPETLIVKFDEKDYRDLLRFALYNLREILTEGITVEEAIRRIDNAILEVGVE